MSCMIKEQCYNVNVLMIVVPNEVGIKTKSNQTSEAGQHLFRDFKAGTGSQIYTISLVKRCGFI